MTGGKSQPAPTTGEAGEDKSQPSVDPRAQYRQALVELAEQDERVLCLDSDMGGLAETFGARFPDRYINVGIAEANMFGLAAGLAARGFLPYAHTMAAFATMRAAEQLKLDLVGNGLPVRVVATHGGLSAAHFGTSHYALEDLAVVRALGDITVVVPGDAREIGPALRAVHAVPGPVYLRLGRSATPALPGDAAGFDLGRAVSMRPGTDVAIIAIGPQPAHLSLAAAEELAAAGVSAHVLRIHTLIPLDAEGVLAAARSTRGLVTVEEHRPAGGLGDAVAEVVAAHHPVLHIRIAVTGRVGTVVLGHLAALESAGVSTAAIRDAAARVLTTNRER
ncbi:MAG TPA: transketolase C-terminal domain-containing protein [Actinocrinis sp.]|nr:transketolase C-terminal domain-containing protein [Actinocrinis sp.]